MKRKPVVLWAMLLFVVFSGWGCTALSDVQVPEASIVYDINKNAIKGLAPQNRINIPGDEIPDAFKKAVIAVEDKKFYRHHGIDPVGILRAAITNIKEGRIVAGGSTITQQTAKNLYLSNERTVTRKGKELVYALQLESRYSKEEILTMYCNTIYFGEGAYGIEVAAHTFFAKGARDLTIEEATLLAGLPQSPNNYNPYYYPEKAKARQKAVLGRMVAEGYISHKESKAISARPLNYRRADYAQGEAPYFIALVRDYLTEKYGERLVQQGGLKIYTTLDIEKQKAANRAFNEGLQNRTPELQGALVAIDPRNGYIVAMIGGRNFGESTYNRVFSKRQPGSTFKPFMYSLAVARGITAADTVSCEEVVFVVPGSEDYRPVDYGDEPYHWRDFTIKEAVMVSDNVVAVRVNDMLGPKNVASYCQKFGFAGIKSVLSLPLGSNEVSPLEMATAYSVFANRGVYSKPIYILRVEDKEGRVLEEHQPQQSRVIGEDNAYIISDMLKGVLQPGGTGSHLQSLAGRIVAGKTGTTDELKDAWFVGYTPQLCCAVWVGYDRDKNVNLPGGVIAGPIWANFIRAASQRIPEQDFIRPDNVNMVNICLDSGLIACESCPRKVPMAFIEGSEPLDICYEHMSNMEWLLDEEYFDYILER